jgi:hypothetical protein
MALGQLIIAQRDFSAGQVDPNVKRNEDHPAFKAGLRQCINFRQLNTKGVANRFGRQAQFFDGPRVEEILMGPGFPFMLCFQPGKVVIRQGSTVVFTATGMPWTAANINQIVWCILQTQLFITFPGMQPQVISWTVNSTTFAIAAYNVLINGSQKRAPFYRISPHDITIQPNAYKGSGVTVVASAPVFNPAQVGTYLRYIGRQMLITGYTNPTTITVTIEETLFKARRITTNAAAQAPPVDITTVANVGDVVIGSLSGAQAVVTALVDNDTFECQFITGRMFQGSGSGDFIVGPGGELGVEQSAVNIGAQPVTLWDEEVMNSFQGWPASCFADQQRLGFCNFPRVPSGVCWSAISSPFDLYIPTDAALTPDGSIFELAPGKSQVYFVVAGAESDEFVFADNATYWIPINVQNPLSATGAVVFNKIDEGAAPVQPRFFRGAIIYINAAANQVRAIAATGAYNRPYEARDLSEVHRALLISPFAIACPDGDNPLFSERYIYILNSDGSMAVGFVDIENGQLKAAPGFVRWNGIGNVTWVASRLANVWFTTAYPGSTQGTLVEQLDPTRFMDASYNVNPPPAALTPPAGKGPLWWAPGQPVQLLDNGLRQMDTYQTDSNGFIIPQFIGGENLTSPQLVVGQMWTATIEPFIPSPGPGQDVRQRMIRRRTSRMSIYFNNSTGFLFVRLFSGPVLPSSPPLGTVMGSRRVTTYVMGDDATQSAPLREGAEFWRPTGRSYDPRVAIVKDTVGPLAILELGAEVTV